MTSPSPGRICVRHPNELAVTNLDGDDLCHACADLWVRGEGKAVRDAWKERKALEAYLEREVRGQ